MSKFKVHFRATSKQEVDFIKSKIDNLKPGDRIVINGKVTQKQQVIEKLRFLNTQPGFKRGVKPEKLADIMGLPKATMRRILRELTAEGITKKIPRPHNTNKYRIIK